MAVLLAGAAFASNASAATTAYTAYDGVYNLIYGNLGSPTYGTITVTYIGADSVSVHESVSPNWLLNNGNLTNLAPLTFNLNGTGVIREGSVEAPFSIATVLPVANPPWGNFTSAINGNCGPGSSSGGCGSGLPPEKWSSLMYGLWPDGGLKNGKEATHCGRDRHEAAAG